MRLSISRLLSPRGAGLGNEVIPYAKAYLGARALGATLIEPPWRLNPRRYDNDFGGGVGGALLYFALMGLPADSVTRQAWQSTGNLDYYDALLELRARGYFHKGRKAIIHDSGMSGGYLGIRRARNFLRQRIFGNASALVALEQVKPEACINVAVHIRGDDFSQKARVEPGVFNASLPLAWYRDNLIQLRSQTSLPITVYLATDSPTAAVRGCISIPGVESVVLSGSATADLAILSDCDLIIPSISSFSMLSIFLSTAPYAWYADHLNNSGGWLSIWGHEPEGEGGGATQQAAVNAGTSQRFCRGVPQGDRPRWPDKMVSALESRALYRARESDLLFYGVVNKEVEY